MWNALASTKSVVIHCHKCAGEISNFRALKWFATIFFDFMGFKYFPSSRELFSGASLFLIDHQVRHDNVISTFPIPVSGLSSKAEFEILTQTSWKGLKTKTWLLLKLWILSEVLSLNGRGLTQCSSRHFPGYYWILAQIHEVGSLWRLSLQIHIQSRAQNSLKPIVGSANRLTGTKGSSNSPIMLQTLGANIIVSKPGRRGADIQNARQCL